MSAADEAQRERERRAVKAATKLAREVVAVLPAAKFPGLTHQARVVITHASGVRASQAKRSPAVQRFARQMSISAVTPLHVKIPLKYP